MSFDRAPDFGAAAAAVDAARDPATPRNTLLAWRIPLGRPEAWLTRLLPLTRCLFTPWAVALSALAVAAAALAAFSQAAALGSALQRQLSAPHLLLWAALIYPVMKALHELAHGLAARHAGAAVPGWGISLLMGVPTPYVDASAASALPLQRQRLAVAAAGMVLELGVAAVALALWLLLQDGLLRELALLVVSIGALSSLAVNANPLLRFDGYHLLCDALDLPNLAERSRRHVLHALRCRLLGPSDAAPVQPAPGEAPWLWLYAPAALLMRWAVMLGLVGWLGALSWPLGAAAAALGAWTLVVHPLVTLWRWLPRASGPGRPLRRRAAVLAAAIAVPWLALPLPDTTVAPGVLWLPEHALVRAQTDGVVEAVLATDGQLVQAGDPLLRLRAPQRDAELAQLSGRVDALQSTWLQALRSDAAAAAAAEHQLQAAQAALAEAQARAEQLTVRSASAGRLALPRAADLPGRFVARGALLAHVITGEPGLVRVAIAHEHAAQLRAHPGPVAVRTADAWAATRTGHWSGRTSGAGALLPSAALGEASGGAIATDPADAQGLRPARPVVLADVPLQGAPLTRIGERAWVRFEQGHAPLAWQMLRALQQQVLGHFNPGA